MGAAWVARVEDRDHCFLSFVYRAMSWDSARMRICRVAVQRVDGWVRIVATDGRRVHVAQWGGGAEPEWLPAVGDYELRKVQRGRWRCECLWLFVPKFGGEGFPSVERVDFQVNWAEQPVIEKRYECRTGCAHEMGADTLLYLMMSRHGVRAVADYLKEAMSAGWDRVRVCAKHGLIRVERDDGRSWALLKVLPVEPVFAAKKEGV